MAARAPGVSGSSATTIVVDVTTFNAVADWNGSTGTDNTSAIQAAIDSVWPNTSGHGSTWKSIVIYFPTGTSSYLVNGTINIDAGSVGSTPAISFVGYGATIYTTTASDSPVWNITDASTSVLDVSFTGLKFYTNCERTSHRLFNAEYTRFSHCRWTGGGSQAVHIAAESGTSTGNSWNHCNFDNMARAFLLQGGVWTTITNCQFQEGCTLNWIDIPSRITAVTGVNSTDTFTSTTHGLFNGTSVTLSALSGGSGLSTSTVYYVTQRTADTFKLATSVGGSAVDLGSDVVSVSVTPNGGSAYSRISNNQIYGQGATLPVVRIGQGDSPGITNNTFTHGSSNAIEVGLSGFPRNPNITGNTFRENYKSDIEYNGAPATNISGNVFGGRNHNTWNVTATMTIASPGVITRSSHGLANGTKVRFSTSGALPTGITAGTTYYVVNTATNTFQISATSGGAAINTTGSQSGTHKLLSGYSPIHAETYGGASDAGNATVIGPNTFADITANGIPQVPYSVEVAANFSKMTVAFNNGDLPISIGSGSNTVRDNGFPPSLITPGDADYTTTPGSSLLLISYTGTISTDRTLTITGTGGHLGDTVRVVHGGSGSNIIANGVTLTPASYAEFTYPGSGSFLRTG